MRVVDLDKEDSQEIEGERPASFDIRIDQAIMKGSKDDHIFEVYPMVLTIAEGESVCLYEEDDMLRNNLLYGLTSNLISKDHKTFVS
jgi:hypothetical protein